jgi:hypothetical protein
MPDEFPDPQKIWQDQPKEQIQMSLDEIRRKAHALQNKGRLASLAGVVISLGLAVFFEIGVARAHGLMPRMGLGVLTLWGLYGAYQAYRLWPGSLAADATLSTSLVSYRRELERRRDQVRNAWRMPFLWLLFAGIAFLIAPALIGMHRNPRLLVNAIPFFVLLFAWLIAFINIRKRDLRNLAREIDELKALQHESRS